jgi:hypothetical protein
MDSFIRRSSAEEFGTVWPALFRDMSCDRRSEYIFFTWSIVSKEMSQTKPLTEYFAPARQYAIKASYCTLQYVHSTMLRILIDVHIQLSCIYHVHYEPAAHLPLHISTQTKPLILSVDANRRIAHRLTRGTCTPPYITQPNKENRTLGASSSEIIK